VYGSVPRLLFRFGDSSASDDAVRVRMQCSSSESPWRSRILHVVPSCFSLLPSPRLSSRPNHKGRRCVRDRNNRIGESLRVQTEVETLWLVDEFEKCAWGRKMWVLLGAEITIVKLRAIREWRTHTHRASGEHSHV
jgi:hypothetical protein